MPPVRFFLPHPPGAGGVLELPGESVEHARALRVRPGDRCEGLDGRGGRRALEVLELGRQSLRLRDLGRAETESAPGMPGAPLPWIELAVAWPRRTRAEAMLGGLVQLGAGAITALAARRRGPEPIPTHPPARWEKLARTALEQSGRAWLPRLGGALEVEALVASRAAGTLALLEPAAGMSFDTWLRSLTLGVGGAAGTEERPLVLVVGPEGGWEHEEREALLLAGASPVWLGPHVLRIETAALAAMAVAATVLGRPAH